MVWNDIWMLDIVCKSRDLICQVEKKYRPKLIKRCMAMDAKSLWNSSLIKGNYHQAMPIISALKSRFILYNHMSAVPYTQPSSKLKVG